MKVAIVGLGKMGLVHASILSVLPGVDLVAACEKGNTVRKFLKKIFRNTPIVDDVEKLSDFSLDAVYVTTPIPSHYDVTRTVYAKRIAENVFVEKTLAANVAESKELCRLSANSSGANMVGYLRRFYVTFRKAEDLLEHGAIGDIKSFRAYAY
jgi:predicted dehydrogenase